MAYLMLLGPQDAKHKNVTLSPHFDSFIDLAAEYRNTYSKLPPVPPAPAHPLPSIAQVRTIGLSRHHLRACVSFFKAGCG